MKNKIAMVIALVLQAALLVTGLPTLVLWIPSVSPRILATICWSVIIAGDCSLYINKHYKVFGRVEKKYEV